VIDIIGGGWSEAGPGCGRLDRFMDFAGA
jgi:hypothetical protein